MFDVVVLALDGLAVSSPVLRVVVIGGIEVLGDASGSAVPEHDAPTNATIAVRQTNERRMRIAPFCLPRRIARGRGRDEPAIRLAS